MNLSVEMPRRKQSRSFAYAAHLISDDESSRRNAEREEEKSVRSSSELNCPEGAKEAGRKSQSGCTQTLARARKLDIFFLSRDSRMFPLCVCQSGRNPSITHTRLLCVNTFALFQSQFFRVSSKRLAMLKSSSIYILLSLRHGWLNSFSRNVLHKIAVGIYLEVVSQFRGKQIYRSNINAREYNKSVRRNPTSSS